MGIFSELIDLFVIDPVKIATETVVEAGGIITNIARESTTALSQEVFPKRGSIVHCKLTGGVEHSGIYVGEGKIVELNGDGDIRKVNYNVFLYGDSWVRSGIRVYIACDTKGNVLYDSLIASRAERKAGEKRNYNLILSNCHNFTCECITGCIDNADTFFTFLEETISNKLNNGNSIKWLPWNR